MHILKGRFLSVEVTLEYKIKSRSTDKSLKKKMMWLTRTEVNGVQP